VVVDAELHRVGEFPGVGVPDKGLLLANLLAFSVIDRYLYADEGPPPTAERVMLAPDWTASPGWVEVVLGNGEPDAAVYCPEPGQIKRAGLGGNVTILAAEDSSTDAYSELSSEDAARRRRADMLACQVASQGVEADLFITEREFLHKRQGYATHGVTVCTPAEAIPLVGLYLRTQGIFPISARHTFGRGLFYWVGARELLGSAWRWTTACQQFSTGSADPSLAILAQSLLQRLDRALEVRDQVHVSLMNERSGEALDDALSGLDSILIAFMAAFDVTSRVAHRILKLEGSEREAGWQSNSWRRKVGRTARELGELMAPGSEGHHLLTLVRLLRNSVHGTALQGLTYAKQGGSKRMLVGLPLDDEAEVLAAMGALGGEDAWGVQSLIPGQTHSDPGVFVERLFALAIPTINDILDRTPVERLPHVRLRQPDREPPTGDDADVFDLWKRQSIRWQLGL